MLAGRRHSHRKDRRGGALLSVELLFLLPILLLFVLAMVELATLMAVETRLATACREGARTASRGGSDQDVRTAVEGIVGSDVIGIVTVSVGYLTEKSPGQTVRVSVSAPAGALVPNYLRLIGFDLQDRILTSQMVMTFE